MAKEQPLPKAPPEVAELKTGQKDELSGIGCVKSILTGELQGTDVTTTFLKEAPSIVEDFPKSELSKVKRGESPWVVGSFVVNQLEAYLMRPDMTGKTVIGMICGEPPQRKQKVEGALVAVALYVAKPLQEGIPYVDWKEVGEHFQVPLGRDAVARGETEW